MILPNISSGASLMPIVLPTDLLIFCTPSVPSSKRHGQDHLWLLTILPLQFSTHQQVKPLVRSPQLNVGLEHHGIVALNERVKKFMNADRLLFLIALLEVFPLEHPGDRVLRGQPDERDGIHFFHPAMVKLDDRLLRVQNFEDLLFVGLSVVSDFLARQLFAGFGLARKDLRSCR